MGIQFKHHYMYIINHDNNPKLMLNSLERHIFLLLVPVQDLH